MAVRFTAELSIPQDEGVQANTLRDFMDMLGASEAYAADEDINLQVTTDDSGEPALLAVWMV